MISFIEIASIGVVHMLARLVSFSQHDGAAHEESLNIFTEITRRQVYF